MYLGMENYFLYYFLDVQWRLIRYNKPNTRVLKFNLLLKMYFGWEVCCSEYTIILAYIHIIHTSIISFVGVGFELLPINHL